MRQDLAANKVLPSSTPLVVFNDSQGMEREPEDATSEPDAIDRLVAWPGMGGTEYDIGSSDSLSVFFNGLNAANVDALSLSVRSKAFLFDPTVRSTFERLVFDLHRSFRSRRTISAADLLSPGTWWIEEVRRVRAGVYDGQYAIDLR
jgi:hypothetical protein